MLRNILFALALCLACTTTAIAADKVGVVNLMAVTTESAPGQAADKELQTRFGAERTQLEKQAEALNKKMEDFNKQAATMSEKARMEKGQGLEKEAVALDEKGRAYAQRLSTVQEAMTNQLQELVDTACGNVAKKDGFDVLLDGTAIVLFAAPSSDATPAVTTEVNNLWKARGSKFSNLPK